MLQHKVGGLSQYCHLLIVSLSLLVGSRVECWDVNATQWSNICMKNDDCIATANSTGNTNETLRMFCQNPNQCLCNRFALNVPLNGELSELEKQLTCTNCTDFRLVSTDIDPCTVQDMFSACNLETGYCECTINMTHLSATAKQIKLENLFEQTEKAPKSVCLSLHVKAHLNTTVILQDITKMFQGVDWNWLVTLIFCYTLPVLALLLFFWFMYTHVCAVEETNNEPVVYHQL